MKHALESSNIELITTQKLLFSLAHKVNYKANNLGSCLHRIVDSKTRLSKSYKGIKGEITSPLVFGGSRVNSRFCQITQCTKLDYPVSMLGL